MSPSPRFLTSVPPASATAWRRTAKWARRTSSAVLGRQPLGQLGGSHESVNRIATFSVVTVVLPPPAPHNRRRQDTPSVGGRRNGCTGDRQRARNTRRRARHDRARPVRPRAPVRPPPAVDALRRTRHVRRPGGGDLASTTEKARPNAPSISVSGPSDQLAPRPASRPGRTSRCSPRRRPPASATRRGSGRSWRWRCRRRTARPGGGPPWRPRRRRPAGPTAGRPERGELLGAVPVVHPPQHRTSSPTTARRGHGRRRRPAGPAASGGSAPRARRAAGRTPAAQGQRDQGTDQVDPGPARRCPAPRAAGSRRCSGVVRPPRWRPATAPRATPRPWPSAPAYSRTSGRSTLRLVAGTAAGTLPDAEVGVRGHQPCRRSNTAWTMASRPVRPRAWTTTPSAARTRRPRRGAADHVQLGRVGHPVDPASRPCRSAVLTNAGRAAHDRQSVGGGDDRAVGGCGKPERRAGSPRAATLSWTAARAAERGDDGRPPRPQRSASGARRRGPPPAPGWGRGRRTGRPGTRPAAASSHANGLAPVRGDLGGGGGRERVNRVSARRVRGQHLDLVAGVPTAGWPPDGRSVPTRRSAGPAPAQSDRGGPSGHPGRQVVGVERPGRGTPRTSSNRGQARAAPAAQGVAGGRPVVLEDRRSSPACGFDPDRGNEQEVDDQPPPGDAPGHGLHHPRRRRGAPRPR